MKEKATKFIQKTFTLFICLFIALVAPQLADAHKKKTAYSNIMQAASENNIELAKDAVSEGGTSILNPPRCPPNGICSPLVNAAERGHLEVLEYMLKEGANPNYVNAYGNTPIIYAAMARQKEAIKLLMQHGADVNQAKAFGVSIFKLSCIYGDEMVKTMLTSHNADVNKIYSNLAVKTHNQNTTALMSFAEKCQLSSVKILVENGADISVKDSKGLTAIDYAINARKQDIVDYLVSR